MRVRATPICYVTLIFATLLQVVFAATAPSSVNGGPRLYISNNTKYQLHVSEATWSHPDTGYYFTTYGGSSNQSYTVGPRSSTSIPGPYCASAWYRVGAIGGIDTPCYWGAKAYKHSQTLSIKSDGWTKGSKDGIKIDVSKLKTGSFELEPDCKQDLCPVIAWSLDWTGDGWKITLNEDTL